MKPNTIEWPLDKCDLAVSNSYWLLNVKYSLRTYKL